MSQLQQAQSFITSELESMQAEGGVVASDIIKKLTLTENLKEAMEDVIYVQVCDSVYTRCCKVGLFERFLIIILVSYF